MINMNHALNDLMNHMLNNSMNHILNHMMNRILNDPVMIVLPQFQVFRCVCRYVKMCDILDTYLDESLGMERSCSVYCTPSNQLHWQHDTVCYDQCKGITRSLERGHYNVDTHIFLLI